MSEYYTKDHLIVIRILGREIPKRPALSTEEVCRLGFKDRGDKADRIVRNAYRKLRSRDVVEIAERGMYRLTQAGVAVAKQLKEHGASALLPDKKAAAKEPKKAAGKKPAKPAKVEKAKKAKKPEKAKPVAKKGNAQKAKKPAKPITKPPRKEKIEVVGRAPEKPAKPVSAVDRLRNAVKTAESKTEAYVP